MYEANLWAVLVAALAAMVIGGLWYSPVLFGKQWLKLAGISEKQAEEMQKNSAKCKQSYFLGFVANLVAVYILGYFLQGAADMGEALKTAVLLWAGFTAVVQLGAFLWEQKPFCLFVLNTSYSLVTILVMSAILHAWQ